MRVVLISSLCLLAACGESASPPPPPAPSIPVVPEGPLRTGTIVGVVRVEGDDLAPLKGSMLKAFEPYCGPGPLDTRLYRIDPATKGVADAYVEADGRGAEFKIDKVPFLDQKECLFDPRMLVIPPGPIVFQNGDSMAHNVTIRGKLNPAVVEGGAPGGVISRVFPFEERLVVRCTLHPWMLAGIAVTSRATHALTDAKGSFRIEGVEAGKRTLTVWHLMGEETKVTVDVPVDGTATLEINWKPRPNFRKSIP